MTAVVAALEHKKILVDGVEFHYAEAGTGTPLVFLHGAGGNKLTSFHDRLGEQHRAIMITQPGFGDTAGLGESVTDREYAAVVGSAARAIAGSPYHLAGTSFGSRIAGWIAVDSPADVLSLSLLAPALLKREGGPTAPPKPDPSLSPAQAEQFTRQMTMVQRLNSNDNSVLLARLGALSIPLSFIFGATDAIISAALTTTYADLYPGAVISVVEDAGHALYADQPDAVLTDVLATVARAATSVAPPRSWRQVLDAIDPKGSELLLAYVAHTQNPALGGIDALTGDLITIATSTAVNEPLSIRTHVARAKHAGATNAQIYQAVLLGSNSGGIPALQAGLRVLDELLDIG